MCRRITEHWNAMQTVSGDSDLDMALNGEHRSQVIAQSQTIDPDSNRLLGFTQTTTTLQNGKTRSVVTTPITYGIDANGSMTSDGLRSFEYDASGRLTKVRLLREGEPATVSYLHNALGQRVFKSELESEFAPPRASAPNRPPCCFNSPKSSAR